VESKDLDAGNLYRVRQDSFAEGDEGRLAGRRPTAADGAEARAAVAGVGRAAAAVSGAVAPLGLAGVNQRRREEGGEGGQQSERGRPA